MHGVGKVKRIKASSLTSIPPEVIGKSMVFLWFQEEMKLINLRKFAWYKKQNLATMPYLIS